MLGKLFKKEINCRYTDAENTACIMCSHVLENDRPILLVTHDMDDGMWQFLCGANGHDSRDIRIVSLLDATNIDAHIDELCEMPIGTGATRESIDDDWKPYKLES